MIYLHKVLPFFASPLFWVILLVAYSLFRRRVLAGWLGIALLVALSLPLLSDAHLSDRLDALVALSTDKKHVVFVLARADPDLGIGRKLLPHLFHHVTQPILERLGEINRNRLILALVSDYHFQFHARRGG